MSADNSAFASADTAANPTETPRAMKGPGLPSGPRRSPTPLQERDVKCFDRRSESSGKAMHPEEGDEQQAPSLALITNNEQRKNLEKKIMRETYFWADRCYEHESTSELEFVDTPSTVDVSTGAQNCRSSPPPRILYPDPTSPLLPDLTVQSESPSRNMKRQAMYGTLPTHFYSLGSAPVTPIGTTMNANLTISTYSSASPDLAQIPQVHTRTYEEAISPYAFPPTLHHRNIFSCAITDVPTSLTPGSQQSTQSSVSSVPPVLDVALDSSAFGVELGDLNEETTPFGS
ncbi:hypothetical protein BD410DRAFT_838183 [Rickenella mellea]|uniref:Uncharacterized protein n=1 Tax=Rickenella mellea TaxID=50990 RepID=A0A4Y7Q8Y3_9AGAM|nr:hypothetical protein BD410DRAFT_838183 [Rickenella mellea]